MPVAAFRARMFLSAGDGLFCIQTGLPRYRAALRALASQAMAPVWRAPAARPVRIRLRMAAQTCHIGGIEVGPRAELLILAGPCALESPKINSAIGTFLRDLCAELRISYIFKASFDKANRSSIQSDRGPGLESGLHELARLKKELRVPVTTDIHLPEQAAQVSEVVDLLQVPAFLCRQTDLLLACARTGRAVNVKKGQFMAPAEMKNVLTKLEEGGCRNRMLTERGTFFGYHRLVNDFIGLGDLLDLGAPVCFDITHSTQLPGAGEGGLQTAGRPDRARLLARAAAAAGVHALFFECHPEPSKARSDAATMLPLDEVPELLREVVAIRQALGCAPRSKPPRSNGD